MNSPMFPNTTNTITWPFGTVKEVRVLEVFSKPTASVAAIIVASPDEQLIMELRPELVNKTKRGDAGRITFHPGGPTLGRWDFQQRWELDYATRPNRNTHCR